jgi:GxxExxY protein
MEFIKKSAVKVFETLGAGFSERVYHNAMMVLLIRQKILFKSEHVIPVMFEDEKVGEVRADLIVNDDLVVELKSVKAIIDTHITQCSMYMKLTGIKNGLVINFPCSDREEVGFQELGNTSTCCGKCGQLGTLIPDNMQRIKL